MDLDFLRRSFLVGTDEHVKLMELIADLNDELICFCCQSISEKLELINNDSSNFEIINYCCIILHHMFKYRNTYKRDVKEKYRTTTQENTKKLLYNVNNLLLNSDNEVLINQGAYLSSLLFLIDLHKESVFINNIITKIMNSGVETLPFNVLTFLFKFYNEITKFIFDSNVSFNFDEKSILSNHFYHLTNFACKLLLVQRSDIDEKKYLRFKCDVLDNLLFSISLYGTDQIKDLECCNNLIDVIILLISKDSEMLHETCFRILYTLIIKLFDKSPFFYPNILEFVFNATKCSNFPSKDITFIFWVQFTQSLRNIDDTNENITNIKNDIVTSISNHIEEFIGVYIDYSSKFNFNNFLRDSIPEYFISFLSNILYIQSDTDLSEKLLQFVRNNIKSDNPAYYYVFGIIIIAFSKCSKVEYGVIRNFIRDPTYKVLTIYTNPQSPFLLQLFYSQVIAYLIKRSKDILIIEIGDGETVFSILLSDILQCYKSDNYHLIYHKINLCRKILQNRVLDNICERLLNVHFDNVIKLYIQLNNHDTFMNEYEYCDLVCDFFNSYIKHLNHSNYDYLCQLLQNYFLSTLFNNDEKTLGYRKICNIAINVAGILNVFNTPNYVFKLDYTSIFNSLIIKYNQTSMVEIFEIFSSLTVFLNSNKECFEKLVYSIILPALSSSSPHYMVASSKVITNIYEYVYKTQHPLFSLSEYSYSLYKRLCLLIDNSEEQLCNDDNTAFIEAMNNLTLGTFCPKEISPNPYNIQFYDEWDLFFKSMLNRNVHLVTDRNENSYIVTLKSFQVYTLTFWKDEITERSTFILFTEFIKIMSQNKNIDRNVCNVLYETMYLLNMRCTRKNTDIYIRVNNPLKNIINSNKEYKSRFNELIDEIKSK